MKEATAEKNPFVSELERMRTERAGGPPWLLRLRDSASARFVELGLPSPRDEEWRQTNVAPLSRTRFRRPAPRGLTDADRALASSPLADLGIPRLVFLNGRYEPGLSAREALPEGLRLEGLAEVLAGRPDEIEKHLGRYASWDDRAFSALNTASVEDGALVVVPSGLVLDEPVHVLHLTTGEDEPVLDQPRTLVLVGDNAEAKVVETHLGSEDDVYFTNAVTELSVGHNSRLDHYRLQLESQRAYHVGGLQAHQGRDSRLVSVNVSLGGALTRNDVGAVLAGEGAEATLDGLYVVSGSQHVDNHTTLDHTSARCASHELYKGILGGAARAVFNGRIIVRPDSQKTDAKQSNRNLLLSDDAVVYTRPQLEIYADDVKCTHGTTVGQLAEEAMFYLRARGIDRETAHTLLVHAFAADVLRRIAFPVLRERIEAEVLARLPGPGKDGPRS